MLKCTSEGCERERRVKGLCRSHFAQQLGRRPKSAEQKAKMSAAAKGKPKSDATRAAMSAAWAHRTPRRLSEEEKRAISARRLGVPWSAEQREKSSGRNSHRWGVSPKHTKRVEYAGINFRSSWEARFAQALDRRGIEWEYEKHRFDLGECTYLIDFYLPETNVFWEVKGWFDERSQRKAQLFREQHPDIPLVVATKSVLQLMEF